jgi:hypothetical protein
MLVTVAFPRRLKACEPENHAVLGCDWKHFALPSRTDTGSTYPGHSLGSSCSRPRMATMVSFV